MLYMSLLLKTVAFTLLKPTLKDIPIPFYQGRRWVVANFDLFVKSLPFNQLVDMALILSFGGVQLILQQFIILTATVVMHCHLG